MIAAERKSCSVQNLELLLNGFVKSQRLIHFCAGIFLGISGKDTVNLSGFQNHIGSDFSTSQRCGSIRCEERITGTGSKNHNPAFLQVAQGFAANIRLGNLVDIQSALNTGFNTGVSQCILEGHCVHAGSQHAHIVAGGTIHTGGAECDSAEDIAAADHDRKLNA